MDTKRVDLVNIGLIIGSLILAILLPFRLLLVAYAVLGPLHFLTEINWLHDKGYFIRNRNWLWLGVVAITIIALPKVVQYVGLTNYSQIGLLAFQLDSISNGVIFLSLWSAIVLSVFDARGWRVLVIAAGVPIAYLLNSVSSYVILVGLLIPTVIHVYLFTGLFMLYGALKSNSKIGLGTAVLTVVVPLVIYLFPVDPGLYNFSDNVKDTIVSNGFHMMSLELAKLLGVTDGKSFLFYGTWELKMQIFLTYAYIYHYLNWFSKTAIIGWHKGVRGGKAMVILIVWAAFVGLFAIDYKLGFISVLGLSFLHVIAEFPLNAVTIKGIASHLAGQLS